MFAINTFTKSATTTEDDFLIENAMREKWTSARSIASRRERAAQLLTFRGFVERFPRDAASQSRLAASIARCNGVGNGGLSLRRVDAMRAVSSLFGPAETIEGGGRGGRDSGIFAEDLWWCSMLGMLHDASCGIGSDGIIGGSGGEKGATRNRCPSLPPGVDQARAGDHIGGSGGSDRAHLSREAATELWRRAASLGRAATRAEAAAFSFEAALSVGGTLAPTFIMPLPPVAEPKRINGTAVSPPPPLTPSGLPLDTPPGLYPFGSHRPWMRLRPHAVRRCLGDPQTLGKGCPGLDLVAAAREVCWSWRDLGTAAPPQSRQEQQQHQQSPQHLNHPPPAQSQLQPGRPVSPGHTSALAAVAAARRERDAMAAAVAATAGETARGYHQAQVSVASSFVSTPPPATSSLASLSLSAGKDVLVAAAAAAAAGLDELLACAEDVRAFAAGGGSNAGWFASGGANGKVSGEAASLEEFVAARRKLRQGAS